jgi:DNA ligase-1
MRFEKYCEYLNKLDLTSKRLEMTAIISDLLTELSEKDTKIGVYLSLGILRAPFEDLKFNFADKQMIKSLALFFDTNLEDIQSCYSLEGDLGTVAEKFYKDKITKKSESLNITEIYDSLVEIANIEGAGSQEKKSHKIISLAGKLNSHLEIKYIVRIILGNLRLGFTELTVIDALCLNLKDKKQKPYIESTYNKFPDIGEIAEKIKINGIKGIDSIKMRPGVPVEPQKAQRLATAKEVIEKLSNCWCEYKFDGTRVQLHFDKRIRNKTSDLFEEKTNFLIKTYTRNLEESTHQYPDLVKASIEQIDAESVILDGEAIGFNKETGEYLPFQETIQRKRKHNVAEIAEQIPLKYLVFDLLYYNGEETVKLPLIERRKLLDRIIKKGKVIEIDSHVETSSEEEVSTFFKEAKNKGLEGIMIKKPDSTYEAGARAFSWIKFKREEDSEILDTIDVVVMGYFYGKGVRSDFGIGGFLVGVFNSETLTYQTVSKIGSGLSDEEWVKIKSDCDKIRLSEIPKDYEVAKELSPDVWVKPELVVSVRADEVSISPNHTSKIALRFPRLVSFRYDKRASDTTSIDEIKSIYQLKR